MQGFCKITASKYLFNFLFEREGEGGGVRVGAYLSWVEGGGGGVLVGANSRLGTYPNKYG